MDILHIDNWRFYTPKKRDRDDTPLRQKQYHTYYAPMNIERWALPLFKSVRLVPKSSKTIARSQIKCASCKICSYHLGLESSDLSPPYKDTNICDICNRTYHWQCLLKPSCCNGTEREAFTAPLPMIHGPALLVSIWIKMKRKAVSTFRRERLWKSHGTQPGSQKNYKTRVKALGRASILSLKGISPHQTYLSLHQMNN